MWDLSSLSRDQTCAPCIRSLESYSEDHQGTTGRFENRIFHKRLLLGNVDRTYPSCGMDRAGSFLYLWNSADAAVLPGGKMSLLLPVLVLFVFGYGMIRKVSVFSCFCDGIRDGLRVCLGIFHVLLLILAACGGTTMDESQLLRAGALLSKTIKKV